MPLRTLAKAANDIRIVLLLFIIIAGGGAAYGDLRTKVIALEKGQTELKTLVWSHITGKPVQLSSVAVQKKHDNVFVAFVTRLGFATPAVAKESR